jgi:hypothetical protein
MHILLRLTKLHRPSGVGGNPKIHCWISYPARKQPLCGASALWASPAQCPSFPPLLTRFWQVRRIYCAHTTDVVVARRVMHPRILGLRGFPCLSPTFCNFITTCRHCRVSLPLSHIAQAKSQAGCDATRSSCRGETERYNLFSCK